MNVTTERQKLTPPQVARLWGVSPDKVLAWIRSGELPAIDAATRPGGQRPRYLIDLADLREFEKRRRIETATGRCRRTNRPTNARKRKTARA